MALASHNFAIQDDAGNIVTDVDIEVRLDTVGQPLVQIFSDRDGLSALGNPFTSATGTGQFYVSGGAYQIRASKSGFEAIQRHIAIGTAAERDAEDFEPSGVKAEVLAAVAQLTSIAALRLLDDEDTRTVVYVTGYYSGSTKGGGWFERSGSEADDGFLHIQDAASRSWNRIIDDFVDAYMAGAPTDGAISTSFVVSGTDATSYIQALIDYMVAQKTSNALRTDLVRAKIGVGIFRCDSTLDFTGLNGVRFYIDCIGTCIGSRAAGLPAIDMSNSDGIWMDGLMLIGDPTSRPAVGYFVNRVAGSVDDFYFLRCRADGEFTYAAFHNSGGENCVFEQCLFVNEYTGDCYAFAQDSLAFLRYDPPIDDGDGLVVSATSDMSFQTPSSHGKSTGDRVYVQGTGVVAADDRSHNITVTGADTFTIDGINGTGYSATGTEKIWFARYFSEFTDPSDDTIEPYVGNGAFTLVVNGGQMQCPYGKAAIMDTPGGRRKWNCRAVAAVHDDTTTSDITITSATSGTCTTSSVHDLSVGDVIYVTGTSAAANNNEFFRIATAPTTTSFTTNHIDNVASKAFADCTGGTLHKQDISGGYAVHLIGDDFEGPEYHNLHLEAAASIAGTHEPNAHFYIQHIDQLNGGSAAEINLQGFTFREHASNGVYGTFVPDSTSVSGVVLTGTITVPRIAGSYGDGETAGKMFISPSLWTVRATIISEDTTLIHDNVNYSGDYISAVNGTNVSRSRGEATSLTTDSSGDVTIAHGLYKTPTIAGVSIKGNSSQQINVFSLGATNITVRVRDAAGTVVASTSINNIYWHAAI